MSPYLSQGHLSKSEYKTDLEFKPTTITPLQVISFILSAKIFPIDFIIVFCSHKNVFNRAYIINYTAQNS